MPSDFWLRTMHDADAGRLPQALAAARMRQRMKPRDPETLKLLGLLLQRAGELDQAIHFLAEVARLDPASAAHRNDLAVAHMQAGRPQEAREHWKAALSLDAAHLEAWLGLSAACLVMDDAAGAVQAAERGLALSPHLPALVGNLAAALGRVGRADEAIEVTRRALEHHPGEVALRSSLLLMLSGSERTTQEVLQAHRDFGMRLPAPRPPRATSPAGRALRVGILSSDLRSHSVGYFAAALIEHAPADTHLVAFAPPAAATDPLAQRLHARMQAWHDTRTLDDAALDASIRRERLDVLIELNGHTTGGRLAALARKPAPVIVSAIGYPNTTGLPAIDRRLADSITDPSGSESLCTERLLRLDPCFLCFTPPAEAPEPAMPEEGQPITFGSFNNVTKIGPACLDLWADTLAAVPGSRLLLKFLGSADPATASWMHERLARRGVDAARVEVAPYTPGRAEHLAQYRRVHVALDTVPYNGTTTTCEALWMGVPVVTLLGHRHAARVSASLLQACGRGEWVAPSREAFVRTAAALANDGATLAAIRADQRRRLRTTPPFDAPSYARRLHAALRQVCEEAARAQD